MCARNNSIARASARERSGPTAVACEVTMPCCNAEACEGSIRVSASAPKPVVTPYIVVPAATARSITSRAARTRPRAPSPSATGAPRATRSTSRRSIGSPSWTGSLTWRRLPVRRRDGDGVHDSWRISSGTSEIPSPSRSTRNARAPARDATTARTSPSTACTAAKSSQA